MTDSELELHISSLAVLIEKAMAEGDRAAAVAWSNARTAAIKSRSQAQIDRMEAEQGLAPCYFHEAGQQARAQLEAPRCPS